MWSRGGGAHAVDDAGDSTVTQAVTGDRGLGPRPGFVFPDFSGSCYCKGEAVQY